MKRNPTGISKADWRKRLAGLSPRAVRMLETAAAGIDRRRITEARQALIGAMTLAPAHPEVLRLQGVLKQLEGRHADAVATLRAALELRPGDALILNNLGSALRASGAMDAALHAYTQATERAPQLAAAWYNLGRMLKIQARLEEARSALEHALDTAPEHVPAHVVLGDTRKALGDIPGAAMAYRKALKIKPGSALAWFGLANLKTLPLTHAEAAQLAHQLRDPALAADDRIFMGFAHAKALEDINQYPAAFAALQTANARKRRWLPWDAQAFSRSVDAVLAAFSQPSANLLNSKQGKEVMFVVSMPRSGSTLIEQILSAHAEVEGASELPDLTAVISEESRVRGVPFPGWVADAEAEDWQRLGKNYLQRTLRWREKHPHFTDKGLDNWQLVGAALAMLPAARIIVCRRDPLETCLACYRQLFAKGQAFSYAIGDLAAYWRDFDRLCRHWQTLYPGRVCELLHENLLADPGHSIRKLLKCCALPFDPACLHPHENLRSVRTASAAQVRQPLQRDTARTQHYGSLLEGLKQALQQAAVNP